MKNPFVSGFAHRLNKCQTVAPSLTLEIVRSDVIEPLLLLAGDAIPNIRFNVAKALEIVAISFGGTPEGREFIRQRITPVLELQRNDPDADVRYFAAKGLQKALAV